MKKTTGDARAIRRPPRQKAENSCWDAWASHSHQLTQTPPSPLCAVPPPCTQCPCAAAAAPCLRSSHLSLVNLPTHCAMSNYFAHNSRPPRNKKLLLPTEKSIINSSWKYEWQQVGAGGAGGRHVLSTPLKRTVMQNIFFWSSKKNSMHTIHLHMGVLSLFSPP